MTRIFLIAAMFALPSTVAFAALDTDGLIAGYKDAGYTTIEVTRGQAQAEGEAIKDNTKVEVVYDNETTDVLKSETDVVEADDDIAPGVTVRDRNRDFVRGSDDDESSDDDSVDDGRDDDGSDDDGDDNGGDDHGDDDRGGDDRGGDDHGGDDHGGDDHGGDSDGGDDD